MGRDDRDDASLVRAAAAGDREAFARLYDLHALPVFRWFAWHVGREGTLASELTAETFAEALRSLDRFRGEAAGSGTAWLFGIARNLARQHARGRRVREQARRALGMPLAGYLDDDLERVPERIDADRLGVLLDEALAGLPEPQRRAVVMRIVEDLDYDEVACALQSSPQAARLRVSRGVRALRRRIATTNGEEAP
jgi:RNA polymerase sigma-70 factor (ECF subfamily)